MSITITWKNCVGASHAGGGDFADAATGSSITASENVSSDATADDFGGSGHSVSQSAASLFVNPGSGDLTPLASGALYDTGADLSASFTTDMFGTTRPQGAAWDIGAIEAQATTRNKSLPLLGVGA